VRIVVLADDLIWRSRLIAALEAIGAQPDPAGTADAFEAAMAGSDGVIVDLIARAYDPIVAVAIAAAVGLPVLVVGPHENVALRKRALAAGAGRALAYRKLFEDGPGTLSRWLGGSWAA
jgi:hypothetical protein